MNTTNTLDFNVVRGHLRDGLECAVNLLDRSFEGPHVPGLQPMLLLTTRHVQAVWRTILHLCSDEMQREPNGADFVVAAVPSARNLADAWGNVAFILINADQHTRWYWASGWREYQQHHAFHRQRDHPEERAWLEEQDAESSRLAPRWGIPPEWVSDPRRIPWWPGLARFARATDVGRAHSELFAYVDRWFYKLMSSSSHATAPGLRYGAMMLLLPDEDRRDAAIQTLRSHVLFMAMTLVLAFLSELRGVLGLRISHLPFTWSVVQAFSVPTAELYKLRYQALLANADEFFA